MKSTTKKKKNVNISKNKTVTKKIKTEQEKYNVLNNKINIVKVRKILRIRKCI